MIDLNIRKVLAAASAAYDEKRLTAQSEDPRCAYRNHHGNPCAVGAAMTEEEAASLGSRNSNRIIVLIHDRKASTDHEFDLSQLQQAHDTWATAARDGHAYDGTTVADAERAFVATLQQLEEKYAT